MTNKIVLLNDLYPKMDEDLNGCFYDQETLDTGVVYRIENIMNSKSYIGRAYSYLGNYRHGAKGRFTKHWILANTDNKLSKKY